MNTPVNFEKDVLNNVQTLFSVQSDPIGNTKEFALITSDQGSKRFDPLRLQAPGSAEIQQGDFSAGGFIEIVGEVGICLYQPPVEHLAQRQFQLAVVAQAAGAAPQAASRVENSSNAARTIMAIG